jgi:hypothetical protein
MSPVDDVHGEMHTQPFDSSTADALLSGMIAPDDAPPGLREVAVLVRAARTPALDGPSPSEGPLVAAFAAALAEAAGPAETTRRRGPMFRKVLTAAAGAAALVLSGTAVAAACGVLPAAIQTSVANVADHVGISLPNPGKDASKHRPPLAVLAGAPRLCAAYASASHGLTGSRDVSGASAFAQLSAVAAGKGETVAQYCAKVAPHTRAPSKRRVTPKATKPGPRSASRRPHHTRGAPPRPARPGKRLARHPLRTPSCVVRIPWLRPAPRPAWAPSLPCHVPGVPARRLPVRHPARRTKRSGTHSPAATPSSLSREWTLHELPR